MLTIKDKLRGQVCIFTVSLGPGGMNEEYRRLIAALYTSPQLLEGVCGGIVIDGPDELFTKKIGRELLFIANRAGCLFPGKTFLSRRRDRFAILMYRPACCNQALPRPIKQR